MYEKYLTAKEQLNKAIEAQLNEGSALANVSTQQAADLRYHLK